MRIHSLIGSTKTNGPGDRFAIWVQGCSRRCPGCFNRGTQSLVGGFEMSTLDLCRRASLEDKRGVTVSGGEPFEQPLELFKLLQGIKSLSMHTLVYTGFTYEELLARNERALLFCDCLVDGPYEKNKSASAGFAGSTNQRVLELKNGRVFCDRTGEYDLLPAGEILIGTDGEITATGIFDGRVLTQDE